MNCTVCGKPHTPEAPLTIAHNNEWLCPSCLKELDEIRRPTGAILFNKVLSADEIGALKASIRTDYKGTIKVGNLELPIERFEMS